MTRASVPVQRPSGPPLRVAVVTESFLPSRNGVTTSVCRVLEHLRRRGHDAIVVCPGPAPGSHAGYPVVRLPAVRWRQFPVGLPTPALHQALAAFAPDVVHAASPFVLGAAGLTAARRLGAATVAVFQTDVAGFAHSHGLGVASSTAWRWIRSVHERADVTLAPSTASVADLRAHAVPRVALWGRGVDAERFRPDRRGGAGTARLRAAWGGDGATLVGYVGRLAPEKQVERLAALQGLDGVRLVVVGDGPAAAHVARALPDAVLTGSLDGDDLADAYAALDVFVHTGTRETFGQTLQEAMATGLPVVAPSAGGPLDLVRHGVDGLLYAPQDDAALRACVARLAGDPATRAAMGAAGRAGVLPRSWGALGDELLGHYLVALASPRAA